MTAMIKNESGVFEDRSIQVLHDALKSHYTDIGLYKNGTALKQKVYALSEAGEVCDAVIKEQAGEVKKEIGDVLVTVINWCNLYGVDFMDAYNSQHGKYRSYESEGLCILIHRVLCDLHTVKSVFFLIRYLDNLAENYGHTLSDCLGNAYDKVLSRKTKMMNGALVKEADWHKFPELEMVVHT